MKSGVLDVVLNENKAQTDRTDSKCHQNSHRLNKSQKNALKIREKK
jgi:hypothetical protein